jgi:CheY-like chemotaxis protein
VEDNEGDILLTIEALEEGKFLNKIRVARDGRSAVDILSEDLIAGTLPNLILLDVNLPRMNGHEVLRHIKQHDLLKHLPVIMLTTSSAERDINISYQNHANCYITKPIEAGDFIAAITKVEDFWINLVQLPK